MVVRLDVIATRTLRWNAWSTITGNACQERSGGKATRYGVSIYCARVLSGIGPGRFSDQLKRTSLESPVEGKNTQGVIAGVGSAIAVIARSADFGSQERTKGHTTDNRLSIVDVQAIIGWTFSLPGPSRTVLFVDSRGAVRVVGAGTSRDIEFVVHFAGSAGVERAVKTGSGF